MKTIKYKDLETDKDNCILFSHKQGKFTKYIAKDKGKFKIWTNEAEIERTCRDIKTAVSYYNNPNKYILASPLI